MSYLLFINWGYNHKRHKERTKKESSLLNSLSSFEPLVGIERLFYIQEVI
jgi:hypothetical protein